jgi:hypothetical protein
MHRGALIGDNQVDEEGWSHPTDSARVNEGLMGPGETHAAVRKSSSAPSSNCLSRKELVLILFLETFHSDTGLGTLEYTVRAVAEAPRWNAVLRSCKVIQYIRGKAS